MKPSPFVSILMFLSKGRSNFLFSFEGHANDNTDNHQSEPYQNKRTPTDRGGGVGKDRAGYGGCHVADEIEEACRAGNLACIPKRRTVNAPKDRCGTVGKQHRKRDANNIQDGLRNKEGQQEECRGNHKHKQRADVHISM